MPEPDLVETGISGLDPILSGGIPRANVILLEGAIGTGKTTQGVEFVYRFRWGATRSESSMSRAFRCTGEFRPPARRIAIAPRRTTRRLACPPAFLALMK